MDFLALLHRATPAFRGFEQLGGEALAHRLLAALAGGLAQPAHGERGAADRTDFDRDLEVGAADAAALDLNHRPRVLQRLVEDFHRVLATLLGDDFERAIDDALGNGLLAGFHQHVHEFGDISGAELGVGQDLALGNLSTTGHGSSLRGSRA